MCVARSSALAGLLLVAAGVAYGAEASGALDETKQELRQLQRDQRNKAGQGGDKLKLNAPTIELQTLGTDNSQAWLSDKLKQERRLKEDKMANKNWLVDGVEKLERKSGQSKDGAIGGRKNETASETARYVINQSDPQYLLKIFDQQKKSSDGRSASARPSAPATPDPFAPFLQSWLGSSPLKGQLLDQFAKKLDGADIVGGSSVVPMDYRGPAHANVAPAGPGDPIMADKGNPYLAGLNVPLPAKGVTDNATQLQSVSASLLAPEMAGKGSPVLVPSDPAPGSRDRPKTPLPGLADDKKYFPQLKRF